MQRIHDFQDDCMWLLCHFSQLFFCVETHSSRPESFGRRIMDSPSVLKPAIVQLIGSELHEAAVAQASLAPLAGKLCSGSAGCLRNSTGVDRLGHNALDPLLTVFPWHTVDRSRTNKSLIQLDVIFKCSGTP